MKVNVNDLAKIQIKDNESLDDYINIFRMVKARCKTVIPEYELIQMVVTWLNYVVRNSYFDQQSLM